MIFSRFCSAYFWTFNPHVTHHINHFLPHCPLHIDPMTWSNGLSGLCDYGQLLNTISWPLVRLSSWLVNFTCTIMFSLFQFSCCCDDVTMESLRYGSHALRGMVGSSHNTRARKSVSHFFRCPSVRPTLGQEDGRSVTATSIDYKNIMHHYPFPTTERCQSRVLFAQRNRR